MNQPPAAPPCPFPRQRRRIPLFLQIAIALALGAFLGAHFADRPFWSGGQFGNRQLGGLATFITTMLKTLAAPLVFFAVLDAYLRTEISWERGRKLLMFSLLNVSVAMVIGLAWMNWFRPGQAWTDHLQRATSDEVARADDADRNATELSHSLRQSLARIIPSSVVQPFAEGNLLALIALALLMGAAYRAIRDDKGPYTAEHQVFERLVETCYEIFIRMLEWIVRLVPLAVFGAVAQSVAETGWDVFRLVSVFLVSILAGLTLHAFGYYTLVAWWYGGKPPRIFLGRGWEAILTGLSTNSSLATVPVTLHTLTQEMGVSDQSARLSACVGTNFNNDGITLYEAMTAIFLAQAVGMPMTISGQVQTVAICVIASLGAAGIPQGGLAVLPLVLHATGLSNQVVATAMPLIMTVDWMIARYRSSVNVMGDMVVAIQLDRSRADMEMERTERAPTRTNSGKS